MQTLVRDFREIKKADETVSVRQYISALEAADNKTKSEIENQMVNLGSQVVEELVNELQVVTGKVRGVVAMTLIRIGQDSIAYLEKAASENKEFEWVAKYLIDEITLENVA